MIRPMRCHYSPRVSRFWVTTNSFVACFWVYCDTVDFLHCVSANLVVFLVGLLPRSLFALLSSGWWDANLAGGSASCLVFLVCVLVVVICLVACDHLRPCNSFLTYSFFSCKDRALERDRPYQRKKKDQTDRCGGRIVVSVADGPGPSFRCGKRTTKVASDVHPQHIHVVLHSAYACCLSTWHGGDDRDGSDPGSVPLRISCPEGQTDTVYGWTCARPLWHSCSLGLGTWYSVYIARQAPPFYCHDCYSEWGALYEDTACDWTEVKAATHPWSHSCTCIPKSRPPPNSQRILPLFRRYGAHYRNCRSPTAILSVIQGGPSSPTTEKLDFVKNFAFTNLTLWRQNSSQTWLCEGRILHKLDFVKAEPFTSWTLWRQNSSPTWLCEGRILHKLDFVKADFFTNLTLWRILPSQAAAEEVVVIRSLLCHAV